MNEATKRVRSVANLKEIEASTAKDKFLKIFMRAGMTIDAQDIEIVKQGNTYIIDVMINGEPSGFDLENDILTYQGFDKEVELGNINREQEVVDKLKTIF